MGPVRVVDLPSDCKRYIPHTDYNRVIGLPWLTAFVVTNVKFATSEL